MRAGGTWMSEQLLDVIVGQRAQADASCRHHSFELFEGNELVAVTLGYSIGRCYHDYSMATFVRDKRSLGHLLTKAQGHLLKNAGYSIWYFGIKGEYMKEFDSYGGANLDRIEFHRKWMKARAEKPKDGGRVDEGILRRHPEYSFIPCGD